MHPNHQIIIFLGISIHLVFTGCKFQFCFCFNRNKSLTLLQRKITLSVACSFLYRFWLVFSHIWRLIFNVFSKTLRWWFYKTAVSLSRFSFRMRIKEVPPPPPPSQSHQTEKCFAGIFWSKKGPSENFKPHVVNFNSSSIIIISTQDILKPPLNS